MSAKGPIIRLQVDIPAKEALDALCDRRGLTQIAVTSRLLSWFVAQNEVVHAAILGPMSESTKADLREMLLKQIVAAAEKRPST